VAQDPPGWTNLLDLLLGTTYLLWTPGQ